MFQKQDELQNAVRSSVLPGNSVLACRSKPNFWKSSQTSKSAAIISGLFIIKRFSEIVAVMSPQISFPSACASGTDSRTLSRQADTVTTIMFCLVKRVISRF